MCAVHGHYEAKVINLLSKTILTTCPQCADDQNRLDAQRQAEIAAHQRELAVQRLFGKSGIPPRFAQRNFENYRATSSSQKRALTIAKTYAEQFDERLRDGGGLVFHGKPGTGKTHLACAIANAIIPTGRSVLFQTVYAAIRCIKDTFRKDSPSSEAQVIRGFMKPDLLILDEVGVQFGSDTEKLILFEILNGRYEQVRPTILLSNLPETELVEFVGSRNVDRLKEGGGVVLAFDWDSYRGQVHRDAALSLPDPDPVRWAPYRDD